MQLAARFRVVRGAGRTCYCRHLALEGASSSAPHHRRRWWRRGTADLFLPSVRPSTV